ncbi:MAG: hypothetical protein JWM89_1363 [Acidimicrobiales bacterium]|nr:hypothetical protein [Acidimicrobiales bacterium]
MIGHHRPTGPRPPERERGAILIITAVSMTALLILASIVIDLGQARSTKRTLQNVVDVAALAAGYHLSGHGNGLVISDPQNGCVAAFRSVRENLAGVGSSSTIPCTQLAATAEAPDCTTSTPMKTVTSVGSGSFTVAVSYPVPDSEINDSRLLDGAGWNDGQSCTRMQVQVTNTRVGAFSALAGRKTIVTSAKSVVRGGINTQNGAVPALLVLDRTGCQTVTNASNGNGNLGIIVRAVSDAQGGHVHSDSNGSACGTNSTSYVVYGSSNSNGGTSITVANGSNGILGSISTYATSVGSLRGAAVYPSGISHPVTAGPVVSRLPFDRQFNPSTRPAISNLHSAAWTAVNLTATSAAAAGYTVVSCSADGSVSGAKIFVNCSNYQPTGATFVNADTVAFSGQITVGSGKYLNLPSTNRVYVRGCPACTGGNYYSISVAGGFYLNIGNNAVATASCDNRTGPGAGGSVTNTSVLVSFGSPFLVTGQARLCQTTYYMGANASTYVRQSTTSGLPNCSSALPCPISSGAAPGGSFAISGDNTQWTAPNQQTTVADELQPFEDMGLWSESSDLNQVKSGGVLNTGGIFFTPNAPVEFRSPAVGAPRNAQFVSRTLQLLQGTLDMKPVSSDAVKVPLPGGYGLIR